MSTGPFGSMLHKSDYVENGIPLVNPANIVAYYDLRNKNDEKTKKSILLSLYEYLEPKKKEYKGTSYNEIDNRESIKNTNILLPNSDVAIKLNVDINKFTNVSAIFLNSPFYNISMFDISKSIYIKYSITKKIIAIVNIILEILLKNFVFVKFPTCNKIIAINITGNAIKNFISYTSSFKLLLI
jgi:hypothetical protein